jgi:hypothetical protein
VLPPTFPNENIAPLLSDKDGGKRLFAYAYIYARPNPQHLADLVHSVTGNERTPPPDTKHSACLPRDTGKRHGPLLRTVENHEGFGRGALKDRSGLA